MADGDWLFDYVALEPDRDGGFTARVPGLNGCVATGASEEEALENIKRVFTLWRQATGATTWLITPSFPMG